MRILVVGLPRSGTTWFARTLAEAPGVFYLHEPDNRRVDHFAYWATLGLGPRPYLTPGERAPNYELLWDLAFAGGWSAGRVTGRIRQLSVASRTPKPLGIAMLRTLARVQSHRRAPGEHQLVKSALSYLCAEWISARYKPNTVLVWRSPLNTLPSFLEKGWAGERLPDVVALPRVVEERLKGTAAWPPPDPGETASSTCWAICADLTMLLDASERNPDWLVSRHESMTVEPSASYRRIFERLGLKWSEGVDAFLQASDRPGTGFEVQRIADAEFAAWKKRLSPVQIREAIGVMRRFEGLPGIGRYFTECLREAD